MNQHEEQKPNIIPPNFIEKGKFMGGMFDIRNAIEGGILAAAITFPVAHLPLSLTIRIIILCMTALPVFMVSLIGIGGQSISAFLINALLFLKNRRFLLRSDVQPDPKGKQPRRRSRDKEYKSPKYKKKASSSKQKDMQTETPAKKKERRQFDTSTRRGIRKQAREDIRFLKYEARENKKQEKQTKKLKKQAEKEARLEQARFAREQKKLEKQAMRSAKQNAQESDTSSKKKKEQSIEDYLPVNKIANGVIYTTDGRYIKILEVEPINFLLRSAREQQGIIFSFISYLKISPIKLQIKMISKRADINKHLAQSVREMEQETDPHCQELQKDYIQFVQKLSSKEEIGRAS